MTYSQIQIKVNVRTKRSKKLYNLLMLQILTNFHLLNIILFLTVIYIESPPIIKLWNHRLPLDSILWPRGSLSLVQDFLSLFEISGIFCFAFWVLLPTLNYPLHLTQFIHTYINIFTLQINLFRN